MEKYYRFLVIFLVISCWIPHIVSAQVVNVPDPNLAAAVRDALGLVPNAPITRQHLQHLQRLRVLEVKERQITNLTGLEHATQLEVLILINGRIRDLNSLKDLTRLEILVLGGGRISNVSPLAGLTQLETLWLADNQIRDVNPLSGLTQLKTLNLRNNQISNVNPFTGLTQLETLELWNNQIQDVRPLSGLTQLKTLTIGSNQISNINPLAGLTQLELLALNSNQISDIQPLAGLTQLEKLFLEVNQISDVRPLSGLTRLKELWLAENDIRDVSPLAKLVNLETLFLARNLIRDTSPLASLTKLVKIDFRIAAPPPPLDSKGLIPDPNLAAAVRETLDLAPNVRITKQAMQGLTHLIARNRQITNLMGLEHATRLVGLSVSGNLIQDISPLAELTQLVELDLAVNQIRDVHPLAGLTRLAGLGLSHNQITDVNPIAGLVRLKVLWLWNNRISDVSPLAGLINLEKLYLVGNPITDTSPLASLTKLVEVDIEISKPMPVVNIESPDYPPMYWVNTNNNTLHRLVNTEVENLVLNVRNATNIAIDVENEKLYWTEQTSTTTGRIRCANLDGTNVRLVKELTSVPRGIALDTAGGKIYLTNAWGKVQRLDVDGSNFQPDLITGLDTPGGLAVDVSEGKVYWTEMPGRIRRANLDGSNIQDVATGLGNPINIAISGDTLYWTEKIDEDKGEIRSTNLNGNSNVMIHHSFPQGFPIGIAVDAVENKLYWTTSRGSISRSSLDGSTSEPNFVTGLSAPGAFVLNVEAKVDTDISVSIDESVDVLIYTGDVWWITRSDAITESQTTKRLLQAAGIQTEITENEDAVKQWMLQTTSDGSVNVLIFYGLIPTTIYPPGNAMPDGSIAEKWIETRDGNTILNHADYLGFWSTGNINFDGQVGQWNGGGTLQNLMDIPNIFIPVDRNNIPMFVTTDGSALTPSLVNFQSDRAFPLDQLEGDWYAEKILASNTGDARATLADPVVVRDGNRGRIVIVHQTELEDNPKGEVAAELIINYLHGDVDAEGVVDILTGDVNADGVVNVKDLVYVAQRYRQTGTNPADVNGDKVVNVDDLVLVAAAIDAAAAAPSLRPRVQPLFTTAALRHWLLEAKASRDASVTYQRGILVLEQLLALLTPKETVLLANYPNPFNPETWIPYQLAKPGDVTLTIYAVNGKVVRRLVLGHQLAGVYQSKSRAAYWDGRNEWGELVASGLYFYTLTAGDFTVTRRMLIRK